jgi:hypothetical protein
VPCGLPSHQDTFDCECSLPDLRLYFVAPNDSPVKSR